MKCYDKGSIQSFLDGELNRVARKKFSQHIEKCIQCQQSLKELKKIEEWTDQAIKHSFPAINEEKIKVDVDHAWFDFQNRLQLKRDHSPNHKGGFTLSKKTKKWIAGSAAAVVIASSFAFPQVRAVASDFLSNFRMQEVEFVKMTQEDIRELSNYINSRQKGKYEIKGIGSIEVVDGQQEFKSFETAAEAQKAGYWVPSPPKGMNIEGINIEPGITLRLKLDTEKANKMLNQLKSKTLFDENLNGKVITLTIPESTRVYFSLGDQKPKEQHQDILIYNIFSAPVVNVSENVDINKLRTTILGLPFIPENIKSQLASIENWQETLPIPVSAQILEQGVTINGVSGKYAEYKNESQQQSQLLIWQKNDKVHFIQYDNSTKKFSPAQLVEIAESLS